MKTCCLTAAFLAVMVGVTFSSMADTPPLVYSIENTGTNFPAPPLPTLSHLPVIQPLPDPFYWASDPLNAGGTASTNFTDWEHHRNEIAAQIENYEIGTKPIVGATNVTASYSGGTTPGTTGTLTVHVTVNGHTLTLTTPVSIPAGATAPYPICIGMDSPYGSLNSSDFTSRGIAGLAYSESQVSPYGNPSNTDPYHTLYPAFTVANTGQYSAWAWGVSRIIDGLTLVTNTLPIDLKHIAVTGCSYAGKLALFSGAFDERIALTIAQESGGGGATSWRYSHTEAAGTVEDIDDTDYNWFMDSMNQFSGANVSHLPEDHHELMAMVAPRALFVTANPDYTWLSNPSCYVCSRACQQAYNTLGIPDRFGFSIVGGHAHCQFPASQDPEVSAFLDKFMLGITNANTTVRDYPTDYATNDYPSWYAWWGTKSPVLRSTTISLNIPAAATKGDGTLSGQGSVSVNSILEDDLVVNLTSSDSSKVTVPASVVIPAGQTNVVFDLTIINDSLLDGDQVETVTASALNSSVQATITIHDNQTATLSVILPATASKSSGTLVNAGFVSIGTAVAANIPVSLTSGDPSRLIVPSTTVISTGQTSAVFNLTFVNNHISEGSKIVSVTAHVQNWTDGSASMTILDDNPPDHFALSAISSPQLIGEPFGVTITAQDIANNTLDYQLPVNIDAVMLSAVTATNTILGPPIEPDNFTDGGDLTLGYSFTPSTNLVVTSFRCYFGDKVSLWTDSGTPLASLNFVSVPGTWVETPLTNPVVLLAGVTYRIGVHANNVTCYFDDTLQETFANGTINAYWYGLGDAFPDAGDGGATYYVDLRYGINVAFIPVSPVVSGNFTSGTWSGNIAVLQAATNVMLQASVAAGSSGISNPFNVLGTPKLAITALSNSVVLSWPVAVAGFNLQEAPTLANWINDPVTPVVVGDRYNVTNALGATPAYFRLQKP